MQNLATIFKFTNAREFYKKILGKYAEPAKSLKGERKNLLLHFKEREKNALEKGYKIHSGILRQKPASFSPKCQERQEIENGRHL